MKRLQTRLIKKLRQLFDFHQPRFRQIDCIDLVLEKKLLLLLSWDTVHAYKICILPVKIIYRTPASAAICRLPEGTVSVDIIIRNMWRSKKLTFKLKRIASDQQTLLYLDKLFPDRLEFTKLQPVLMSLPINVKQIYPEIMLAVQPPEFHLSINNFQFNDYAP